LNFKQPEGKPSQMSFFICYLKLMSILTQILRAIYPVKKRPFTSEHETISELDSALNAWLHAVPDHLKWDPDRTNRSFADQSTVLYAIYYHLQITVHRPFIPTPRQSSPFAYPSLSICANAARSCIHLLDTQDKDGIMWYGHVQVAVFASVLVLLLNTWSGKRSGLAHNNRRELDDIERGMSIFKTFETRWASAGRLRDILARLASAGDVPLAQPVSSRNKRRRDFDVLASEDSSTSTSPPTAASSSLTSTPSDEVTTDPRESKSDQPWNFDFLSSSDLARLPLFYEPFSDSDNFASQSMQSTPWSIGSPLSSSELPYQSDPSHTSGVVGSSGAAFPDVSQQNQVGGSDALANFGLGPLNLEQFLLADSSPPNQGSVMDSEALAMWSNTPGLLDEDAWENYISGFDMVTHFPGSAPRQPS